jgi:hypothetical protein
MYQAGAGIHLLAFAIWATCRPNEPVQCLYLGSTTPSPCVSLCRCVCVWGGAYVSAPMRWAQGKTAQDNCPINWWAETDTHTAIKQILENLESFNTFTFSYCSQ